MLHPKFTDSYAILITLSTETELKILLQSICITYCKHDNMAEVI